MTHLMSGIQVPLDEYTGHDNEAGHAKDKDEG